MISFVELVSSRVSARSRSMTLDSITFDDSRLGLYSVSFVDSRSRSLILVWLAPEGRVILSCLAPGWGLVQSVYGPFYTRTFLEVLFASYSIYTLESHGINNNLLTHWKPFSSCHSILFILHQITILETRLSFTKWGLLRLSIPLP